MSRKTILAVTIALVAALLLSSVAYAITIVVDGIQEAAWTTTTGGQTPGSAVDPNEAGISDDNDISTVRWTNNAQNYYLLVATYANTIWDRALGPDPYIIMCFDTDNNLATGTSFDNCDGQVGVSMDGIDRFVQINGGPTLSVLVFDSTGTPVPGAVTSVAAAGAITEIGINVEALGFTSATCQGPFRGALYFDNQTTDPDDNVPDSGVLTLNCGSPTAVTLESLQAQPTTSPVLPVVLVGLSAAALIGVVFLVRRRKTA